MRISFDGLSGDPIIQGFDRLRECKEKGSRNTLEADSLSLPSVGKWEKTQS